MVLVPYQTQIVNPKYNIKNCKFNLVVKFFGKKITIKNIILNFGKHNILNSVAAINCILRY